MWSSQSSSGIYRVQGHPGLYLRPASKIKKRLSPGGGCLVFVGNCGGGGYGTDRWGPQGGHRLCLSKAQLLCSVGPWNSLGSLSLSRCYG